MRNWWLRATRPRSLPSSPMRARGARHISCASRAYRRVLAARLRARRRGLRRRTQEARPLLRLTAQILALRRPLDRQERARRDVCSRVRTALRRLRWIATPDRVRSLSTIVTKSGDGRGRDVQRHLRPSDPRHRHRHRDVRGAEQEPEGRGADAAAARRKAAGEAARDLEKSVGLFERANEIGACRRGLLQTSYPRVMADGM